jgi:hypothetical membrane protein
MVLDTRLLFGPLAALIFVVGTVVLGLWVPDYSAIRQTVSEIGEMASPMRWPFAGLLFTLTLCLLVFASGVWRVSRSAGRNTLSAICLAWMAIAVAALGVFAFPHPLHGVFGLSELLAYQAPLAFALAWRSEPRMRPAVTFSILMYVLLLASITANLSTLARDSALWNTIKPVYGLVQRSLFICFFLWVAGAGWLLWRCAGLERRSAT